MCLVLHRKNCMANDEPLVCEFTERTFVVKAPCVGDHPCLIPLYLRHNSSDAESVISVFEKGELDILKPSWNMEVILDAGGGIGASAVFLSTMLHFSS